MSKKASVFLVSITFRIRTRKCTKLFTEHITEYFAHAQVVCTRPLLGGGGGGGGIRYAVYITTLCTYERISVRTYERISVRTKHKQQKFFVAHDQQRHCHF